jgi:hypothetical protein
MVWYESRCKKLLQNSFKYILGLRNDIRGHVNTWKLIVSVPKGLIYFVLWYLLFMKASLSSVEVIIK